MESFTGWRCFFLALFLAFSAARGQLSTTFYANTCPGLSQIVRDNMTTAIAKDRRMGASILRLHFHDCFVLGCDASILLDDVGGVVGEKSAIPNVNSVRGYEVIDTIKASVESSCPGVVSCADILTLAARDSVVALGGPSWTVPLGRRDSLTANEALANSDLPPPFFDLVNLTKSFGDKGFSLTEMVALSGAHTIGQAQCLNFRDRLYNETTSIDAAFAASLKPNCPRPTGAPGDGNLAALDVSTPYYFDNKYYVNLQAKKGLLHSDQVLFNGGGADNIVSNFASSAAAFSGAFASAMVKMGNLGPLTGSQGQVRLSCSKVN